MNKAQLQALRAKKLAEAKAILAANATLSAEQEASCTALTNEAKALKAQIDSLDAREALASEVDEAIEANEKVPAPRSGPGSTSQPTPKAKAKLDSVKDLAEEDPKHGFRSIGDFGRAVSQAYSGGQRDERLMIGAAATGLQQGVGADGGFLVPPAFSQKIWDGMNVAPDNLLGRTDQYTVEGESLTFNANAETSRANGSRYGGVRGYWINEAGQMTQTKPTFRQVKLEPQQLAVLVYATEKLLRNAPVALDQYLTKAATEEITFMVSDSIINGTGVGQPKGILASGARVTVAKETSQAAATIVKANIDKMWSRMHPRARANAVWYINVDIEPQLENMSMAVGTGGVPTYLPAGGTADAPLGRLKGRPVMPIEFCPTLGTEGDIICADLSTYASGVQGGVESAMSMHLRFDYAESVFRFMYAVDGQPWLASPITPYKGTNTLSPIVTLATRA